MTKLKYTKSLAEKAIFVTILIAGIGLLLSVYFLRAYNGNNNLIGDQPYFDLRISKQLIESKEIPSYDDLSYGGRPFTYLLGWPTMLVAMSKITGIELKDVAIMLPIVLGFLAILFFGLIIDRFTNNKKIRNLAMLIFILSPPFLYLFSTSNPFAMVFLLSELSFYLLLKGSRISLIFSLIALSLIAFFSLFATLFVLAIFLTYILIKDRKKLKWFFASLFLILAIWFYNFIGFVTKFGFPELIKFKFLESALNFNFQIFFSDFGGRFGLSIFSAFLALIGIYVLWKQKYKYILVYLSVILLIFASVYLNFVLFYLNIVVAVLGSIGILSILERRWESKFIKMFSILILICGIIFSGLSFIKQMSLMEPSTRQMAALNYLEEKANPGSVIFSYYDRGFWFNYIGNKNVMDLNFFYAPKVNERWQDSLRLLNSNNIDTTLEILDKYKVNYIWLDKSVKNKFYGSKEINFLYQLKYDPRFKVVYRNLDVEIWKYEKLI